MKKQLISLFSFVIGIFFVSSCTGLVNGIQPTNISTPTMDPCLPVNLQTSVQPLTDLLYAFDDITFVANYTPQAQLIQPIMDLQSLRRQLDKSILPKCLDALKTSTRNYMNSVILYLSFFMGGIEKAKIDATIKSSQESRAIMDNEYQRIIGKGSPTSQPFLSSGSEIQKPPQIATTGSLNYFQIKNTGSQAINIRKEADIKSALIGSLQPNETIQGFGKDETGKWIMVKSNETYGWISAEMVELNFPLDSIPVITTPPTP